jgi:hypothetical protein
MSYFGSPRIVTNGLIFYYDSDNSSKSWKGSPTTNYVTNASTMSSFNNYGNGTPVKFDTEFGTTGYRMSSLASWNGVYQGISLPSTGTYTFSAWYRYWGGSSNNNGATCYVSGWGGSDSASGLDKTKIGVWQRVSLTLNCTNTSMTLYLISYGGTNDGNSDHSTWEVTMPQVESGSYATPFISGTRSNTQAIVDMTNNYTITANSLTYASNNTFSFNGSTDKLTLGTNTILNGTQDYTIDAVFRTSAAGSVDYIFGNYGSGNSGGLEYYVYQSKLNNYISGNTQSATTLNANQWYISSVVRNGTTVTHYLNGQPDGSSSNGASISTNNPFTVGNGHDYTSEAFGGNIAAIKVYNRSLSATEVQQNFNALRGRYGI